MKIYLLDDMFCYAGEAEIDPYAALPRCTLTPPPATTGTQVAQWVGGSWVTLDQRPESPKPSPAEIQKSIVDATQQRLDDFARTRNYDGIMSACTYATSTVPKFAAEGQYCVAARDATWAKLYQILAEVEAGTRPMPSGYADIEPLLPVLEWPT